MKKGCSMDTVPSRVLRNKQQRYRQGNTIIITMAMVVMVYGLLMVATDRLAGANRMLALEESKQQAMAAAEAVASMKEARLVEIAANNDLGLLVSNPDSEHDATVDPDSPWAGTMWFGDCVVRWFVEPVKVEGYDENDDPVWTVNVPPSPSGTADLLGEEDGKEFIENFDFYHFRIAARAYYLDDPGLLENKDLEELETAGELPWQNQANAISSVMSQRVVQLRLHSLFKYAIFYASEKPGVGDLEMGPALHMDVEGAVHTNGALYIAGGGGIAGDEDYMPIDGAGIDYEGFDEETTPSVVGVKGVYRMMKELFVRAQYDWSHGYVDQNSRPEDVPYEMEEDYNFNGREGQKHPLYPKAYQGGAYKVGGIQFTQENDTRSMASGGNGGMKEDFGGTVRDGVFGDAKVVKTLANIEELAGYPFADHALAPPDYHLWVFPETFNEPGNADYAPNALDVTKRWTVLPNNSPAKYISIADGVKNFSASPVSGTNAKITEYAAKLYYLRNPDYYGSYDWVFYDRNYYWRPYAHLQMGVDVIDETGSTNVFGSDGIIDGTSMPTLYPVTAEGLKMYYQRSRDVDSDGVYDSGDATVYTVNGRADAGWDLKDVYDPYGFELWPVDNKDFSASDTSVAQVERFNGYPGQVQQLTGFDDTGRQVTKNNSFSPNEVPGFYLDIATNGQPEGDYPEERGLIIRERKIKKPGSVDGRPITKPRQYVITMDDSGILMIDDGVNISEYPEDPSMFQELSGDWYDDISEMSEYYSWAQSNSIRYSGSLLENCFKPAWLEKLHISKDYSAEAAWNCPVELPYDGTWVLEAKTGTFGFSGVNAVANEGSGEGEYQVTRRYAGDQDEKWPQYQIIGTGADGLGVETLFSTGLDYAPNQTKWKSLGEFEFKQGVKPVIKIKQVRNTYRYEPAFTYNYDFNIHPVWLTSRLGYDYWKDLPNASYYYDATYNYLKWTRNDEGQIVYETVTAPLYPYGLQSPAVNGTESVEDRNQRFLNIINLCELKVPPLGCSLTTEEKGTYPTCHQISWLLADGMRLRYVDTNQYTLYGEQYARYLESEYVVQFGEYDITTAFFRHGLDDYRDRVSAGLAVVEGSTRRGNVEPEEGRYNAEEYMIAWDRGVMFRRKSEFIKSYYTNGTAAGQYEPGNRHFNSYWANENRSKSIKSSLLTVNVDMLMDFIKTADIQDVIPGSANTGKMKDIFSGMVYMSRTRRSNAYEPRLPRWHHERINLRQSDMRSVNYGFGLGLIDGHTLYNGIAPLGLLLGDKDDSEDMGIPDDAWKNPSGPDDTFLSGFRLRYAEDMDHGRDYESGTYARKRGMTWVTPNQLYLHGNFNTEKHDDSDGEEQITPVALFADFVNVLSAAWLDVDHQRWSAYTTKADTRVNASLITHNIPTWHGTYKNRMHPSEGAHNIVRLNERWGAYNTELTLYGSLVVLNEARFNKCDISYSSYTAPDRNFQFNTDLFIRAGQPPFTPYGVKVIRTVNTVDTFQ